MTIVRHAIWFGLAMLPAYGQQPVEEPSTPPNILVLIGDDMGQETLDCYGIGTRTAVTPTLDQLCADGVRFDRFWTYPECSPTRASILTGQYGFRTGIKGAIYPNFDVPENAPGPVPGTNPELLHIDFTQLSEEELASTHGLLPGTFTLPMALKETGIYRTGAFGKWHLADPVNGAGDHPRLAGFDHFSGYAHGTLLSYYNWQHYTNGVLEEASGYFTTRMTDDAIDWILHGGDEPWFAWVAFTAPHTPLHLPPADHISERSKKLDPAALEDDPNAYFLALVESLDHEVNRILDSIPKEQLDNTYVIFLGDNGTAPGVEPTAPYDRNRVKPSVYNGGVQMPMFINGPGVNGGRATEELVNSTDLFNTIIELAGVDPTAISDASTVRDSVSFRQVLGDPNARSQRDWVYTEIEGGSRNLDRQAIANGDYKFLRQEDFRGLYDMRADPHEDNNLLESELTTEQSQALAWLEAQLANLVSQQPGP